MAHNKYAVPPASTQTNMLLSVAIAAVISAAVAWAEVAAPPKAFNQITCTSTYNQYTLIPTLVAAVDAASVCSDNSMVFAGIDSPTEVTGVASLLSNCGGAIAHIDYYQGFTAPSQYFPYICQYVNNDEFVDYLYAPSICFSTNAYPLCSQVQQTTVDQTDTLTSSVTSTSTESGSTTTTIFSTDISITTTSLTINTANVIVITSTVWTPVVSTITSTSVTTFTSVTGTDLVTATSSYVFTTVTTFETQLLVVVTQTVLPTCPAERLDTCPCRPNKAGFVVIENPLPYYQAKCACEEIGLEFAPVNSHNHHYAKQVIDDCLGCRKSAWISSWNGRSYDDCLSLNVDGNIAVPESCNSRKPVLCLAPPSEHGCDCYACQYGHGKNCGGCKGFAKQSRHKCVEAVSESSLDWSDWSFDGHEKSASPAANKQAPKKPSHHRTQKPQCGRSSSSSQCPCSCPPSSSSSSSACTCPSSSTSSSSSFCPVPPKPPVCSCQPWTSESCTSSSSWISIDECQQWCCGHWTSTSSSSSSSSSSECPAYEHYGRHYGHDDHYGQHHNNRYNQTNYHRHNHGLSLSRKNVKDEAHAKNADPTKINLQHVAQKVAFVATCTQTVSPDIVVILDLDSYANQVTNCGTYGSLVDIDSTNQYEVQSVFNACNLAQGAYFGSYFGLGGSPCAYVSYIPNVFGFARFQALPTDCAYSRAAICSSSTGTTFSFGPQSPQTATQTATSFTTTTLSTSETITVTSTSTLSTTLSTTFVIPNISTNFTTTTTSLSLTTSPSTTTTRTTTTSQSLSLVATTSTNSTLSTNTSTQTNTTTVYTNTVTTTTTITLLQ